MHFPPPACSTAPRGFQAKRIFAAKAALFASIFVLGSPVVCAQNGPGAASAQAVGQHRADLLTQCPAEPVPPNATDLPIHVDTWGTGGPTVLLVHGGVQGKLGGGPATFDKQEPLAEMGWKVVRVDRPGFGKSPTRGPDDQEAAAVWVAGMLGSGSNLIGHSFGGAISLLAAARRPDAVRALVLVEPGIQALLTTEPGGAYDSITQKNGAAALRNLTAAQEPADFARAVAVNMGTDGHGGPNGATAELAAHPEDATSMGCALLRAHSASAATLRTAADAVVAAHIPVLVISGGYNPTVDATDQAIARILHGGYLTVKSPNHFVQQASPEEFNRLVNDFMRQADAARRAQKASR